MLFSEDWDVGSNAVVPLVINCNSVVPNVSTVIMLLLPSSCFIIGSAVAAELLANAFVEFSSGFSQRHSTL
jgi:hypothetical protein